MNRSGRGCRGRRCTRSPPGFVNCIGRGQMTSIRRREGGYRMPFMARSGAAQPANVHRSGTTVGCATDAGSQQVRSRLAIGAPTVGTRTKPESDARNAPLNLGSMRGLGTRRHTDGETPRSGQRTAVKLRPHPEIEAALASTTEPVLLARARGRTGAGRDEARPPASTACWPAAGTSCQSAQPRVNGDRWHWARSGERVGRRAA